MGKLLAYSIVSGFIMLVMYLAYKLFIARDNQHGFNRGILLLIYLVSFSAYNLYSYFNHLTVKPTKDISYTITEIESYTLESSSQPIWGTILIWIFLIGAFAVGVKTLITWIRIVRVIHEGVRLQKDGFTLVITDKDKIAPFSWIHYIVINRNDFDNKYSAIIAHELKHINSFHWVDLLIAQVACIINWFNPAVWLMRDELMLVHEYQADMAVIQSGHEAQEYQMLLVKKAVGSRFPSLANSINHSKLKKRITMMYKSKSGAGSKLKALALVPMVALALVVANVPKVKAAISIISNSDVSLHKDSENPTNNPKYEVYEVPSIKVKNHVSPNKEDTLIQQGGKSHSVQYKVTTLKVKSESSEGNHNSIATEQRNLNLPESARFNITSLNNTGKETTVVVKGEGLGDYISVSGGTFIINGQNYSAKSLITTMTNGAATITAVFPVLESYENASIVFNINGQDIKLNLDELHKNSQTYSISISPSNGTVISNGKATLTIDMEIYLDGKKISEKEMKALNPETISSMSIDKQKNAIYITSK